MGAKKRSKQSTRKAANKSRKVLTRASKMAAPKQGLPAVAEATFKKRRGFVVHVPDLSAKVTAAPFEDGMQAHERRLRSLMTLDAEHVDTAAVEAGIGDEERALLSARVFCNRLLKNNEDAVRLAGSLIATRRLYTVFYRVLQDILREAEAKGPVPAMAEDYLVQNLMHQAAQPFDSTELMQGFVDTVLPFVADVVDRHIADDAAAALTLQQEELAQRKEMPIPLGFRVDVDSEAPELPRNRALVLFGWSKAVLFVIEQVVNHVLAQRGERLYQVVRFLDRAPQGIDPAATLVRVAPNDWKGCANSEKALATCMGLHVMEKQAQLVDLLVCDDLPLAYNRGFFGRPRGADAGDAHKMLRRWCDKGGAALLCGLQLDEEIGEPDWRAPELEQLRTFAAIRPVRVLDEAPDLEPGKHRIIVGTSLHRWDVAPDVLDSYGRSAIIRPSE